MLSVAVLVGFFANLVWELFRGGGFSLFWLVARFGFAITHFGVLYGLLATNCRRTFEPRYRAILNATRDIQPPRNVWYLVGIVPFAILFDWGTVALLMEFAPAFVQAFGLVD